MAAGDRGLWVPIHLHPRPGGRRARSESPRGSGEGPAALLLPARGLEWGAELPGGEAGPPQASAVGLPSRARVSRGGE